MEKQGFKPSDCRDNTKKQFLIDLSKQMWIKDSITSTAKNIDLKKLYTPATDMSTKLPKQKKLYSSSVFYSPVLHPTLEEQIAFARIISRSLTDVKNQKSKGQSMYMQRKTRSAKWVYESVGCFEEEDLHTKPNKSYDRNNYCEKNSNVIIKEAIVPINHSKNFCNIAQTINANEINSSRSTLDVMNLALPSAVKSKIEGSYLNSIPLSVLNKYTNVILDPKRKLAYQPCIPKGWKYSL